MKGDFEAKALHYIRPSIDKLKKELGEPSSYVELNPVGTEIDSSIEVPVQQDAASIIPTPVFDSNDGALENIEPVTAASYGDGESASNGNALTRVRVGGPVLEPNRTYEPEDTLTNSFYTSGEPSFEDRTPVRLDSKGVSFVLVIAAVLALIAIVSIVTFYVLKVVA